MNTQNSKGDHDADANLAAGRASGRPRAPGAQGQRPQPRPRRGASCDNDPGLLYAGTPLQSRILDYQVIVDVPYSAAPPDMRPGEAIDYTGVPSQFAPLAGHIGAPVYSTQLDNAATTSSWTLPR